MLETTRALRLSSDMKASRAIVVAAFVFAFVASLRADHFVYFGTYTGAKSKGIYVSRMTDEGKLSAPELAAETANPTYLAVNPGNKFLYSIGEVSRFGGKKAGSVSAFAIDSQTGKLTPLNQQSSGGDGPCHIALDEKGRCVVVAMPRSALISAASSSSSEASSSFGERLTMRLISCASLLWVFCRPVLNLSNKPMEP